MDDIIQRYLDMENSGIGMYFDADEIVDLLDYFEEIDDFDHYKKVMEIGKKLHPHDTEIKIRLCKSFIYNDDFDKALALVEQLCDTGDQEVKMLKCECLCALDRYDELSAYLETMKTDPADELQEIYEYIATILREQYETKNAYDFVKRGQALFPESITLKEELCYHLDFHFEVEKAIDVCRELIDYDPYCVDYWYILGRLYAITEDYDKAIDAFDFALTCDMADLEVQILKAFCYFMKEDFEKVVELYNHVCPQQMDDIHELNMPHINIAYDLEHVFGLIEKMIEMYDNFDIDCTSHNLIGNRDDNRNNGILSIADCFPSSLLFLFFKELILMAEGNPDAVRNIEQIVHLIHQNGVNNKNFRIDPKSKYCLSLKQKTEELFKKHTPAPETEDNDDSTVRQIIKHFLDGNIKMICQLYDQTSPEAITDYLGKIFPAGKKRKKQHDFYLRSDEIYRDENDNKSSNELSEQFLANKNLHN